MFPSRDSIQGVVIRTRMEDRLREADEVRLAHATHDLDDPAPAALPGRQSGPSITTLLRSWAANGPFGPGFHHHLPGARHGHGHAA